MEKNGVWHSSFSIPAFMVNTERKATLTTICNLLQEVAGNHALFHQLSYEDMKSNGQFWVLNRLRVKMDVFPEWKSNIEIQTWVNSMKGPFSFRNFAIYNEEGNLLGSACTLWVLLDVKTRRPVRIQEHSLPILEGKDSLCGQPDKLTPIEDLSLIGTHNVKFSDLDMISHVNNAKYVEWVLNHEANNRQLYHTLEVNYLKESFMGDEVGIYANNNNYILRKLDDKDDLCRISMLA